MIESTTGILNCDVAIHLAILQKVISPIVTSDENRYPVSEELN